MEFTNFNFKDPVMLFAPFSIDKVLSGEKTVTRRLAKSPKCKYRPGLICSIKINVDSDSLGLIEIVDVKKEVLGQLTSKEAMLEGFGGKQGFYLFWDKLYGNIDFDTPVWRIEFSLKEL